jgi:hypothetical protein
MSDQSKTAGRALLAALLLCAFIGTVRAQESYLPPATMEPAASAAERDRQDDEERHLAERRQKMIDDCEQNHGSEVDCERETDTELRAEGMRLGAHVIHLRPAGR